ncbi:MAG: VWA domain-containing protein [Acidobacteria bacterium]|nr:VWA domain-containing protein [Acidobacteriota bacterium]
MKGKGSFLIALCLSLCSVYASLIAVRVSGQERNRVSGQTQPQPQSQSQSGQSEKSERPRRVTTATKSDATKTEPVKPKDLPPDTKPAAPIMPSPAATSSNEKPPAQTPDETTGKLSESEQQPTKPGQQPPGKQPDPEPETIRINSRLVTVPVSVTDASGNPIRNLTAEDFIVEEDGVTQQVQTMGEPGKTPLEMILLFDVSRSIRNRFDFEREAASRFVTQVLKQGDGISIFAIGGTPKLAVDRTDNIEKAIGGAQTIQPTEDSTAFFDTIVKAAQHISDSANPEVRRVMVVLSDGEDTNSVRFKLNDALTQLQRAECLFYSINPSGPSIFLNRISVKGQDNMFKLATETGGMAFLPDKIEDLTHVFNQITAELQAQYLLGYYSTNETTDGKFRRIKVKAAKSSELRIRARNGYYAPKE